MTQQAFFRTATPAFVVIAEFVVKEGMLEVFLAHAFDDAQNSLAKEPGCLQFDVLRTPDHPNGVMFYEVYQSRQAFDEHLKTPHVDKFRAHLAEFVQAEQPVRTLERLSRVPTLGLAVNEAIRTVGFVGTGIMGAPMARHLAAAGFRVTAYNRSMEKAMPLAEHGVRLASSAAEACADQDGVVVMLNSGQVCEELLFAPETGALFAMRPGCLLIVMSSLKVETAKDHARRSRAVGVGYLDAPVSGGEVGAKAATLSIMVGGEAADVARARPLFEAMGRPLHMGPTGTGQLTKLANQLTVASTIVAVAEALLLAERGGADPAKVREALLGGFAQSKILELHGRRMIEGDFVPGGTAVNQIKDTQAAIELAQALSLELPMLELTDSLFRDLVDHGHGELDHSALILELRRRNIPVGMQ